MDETVTTAVLVEGESDRAAVQAAAAAHRLDLNGAGVIVVPMGGATNVRRYATEFGPKGRDLELLGLCDIAELKLFTSALSVRDVYVCDADLEDELIRAMGIDEMMAFIDSQGELKSFRTMQKQPHQRDRSIEHHLHNYCGIKAGRKVRYAGGMVEWLAPEHIPAPLRALMAAL